MLRYGEPEHDAGVQPAASPRLVREICIPSARLKRWNMEILVTGLNASGYASTRESTAELEESVLVPPMTIPNSYGGRVGFVRYPVHKALIVADGIGGAIEFGRLPIDLVDGHPELFRRSLGKLGP